ncbi:hypothetical protein Droror1_Dr00007984 [Drosera rotundifolia]
MNLLDLTHIAFFAQFLILGCWVASISCESWWVLAVMRRLMMGSENFSRAFSFSSYSIYLMIDTDTSFEEKLKEMAESVVPPLKKQIPTPKAIIHQKFGSKASFTIEEVQENLQNECPGLAIPLKDPCLFRCRLELPGLAVVSATCKRKRDAEQSASEKALNEVATWSIQLLCCELRALWRTGWSRHFSALHCQSSGWNIHSFT